jgi:methylmalonyl-CoA mutase cobalamin-binding subunit
MQKLEQKIDRALNDSGLNIIDKPLFSTNKRAVTNNEYDQYAALIKSDIDESRI